MIDEQEIYRDCITKNIPEAIPFENFWVGQDVIDEDRSNLGPVYITDWEVPGIPKPSSEDIDAWLQDFDTTPYFVRAVRAKRDNLLSQMDARRLRHSDEVSLGLEPTEPLQPLLLYIQALRDIPQQAGFPHEVVWPTDPLEE